jgi:hypothetical protein
MSTPKKKKYAPAVAENEALVTAVTIKLRKVLNFRTKLRMYADYDHQHRRCGMIIKSTKNRVCFIRKTTPRKSSKSPQYLIVEIFKK